MQNYIPFIMTLVYIEHRTFWEGWFYCARQLLRFVLIRY